MNIFLLVGVGISIAVLGAIAFLAFPNDKSHVCTACPTMPSPVQKMQIPDNETNQTTIMSQGISEPTCATKIQNQTIFSGYAGSLSCPPMPFYMSTKLVNYTGFYGMYDTINRETVVGPDTYPNNPMQEELDESGDSRMLGNFVLEPGHNGTITYTAAVSLMKCGKDCPSGMHFPTVYNETNIVDFVHRKKSEIVDSHYGLDVTYNPLSESIKDNDMVTITATITASSDIPRGTYWIILEPGNCAGGPLVLLTVSDCEQQK